MKTPPKKKTAKVARPASPRRRAPSAKAVSPTKAKTKAKAKTATPAKAKKTTAPVRRKPAARPQPLQIPALLLEGDAPSPPPGHGPGERYALGTPSTTPASHPGGWSELPEAYGTQRLVLTARDPRWIYAHWDMTQDQLRQHNGQSKDRHLVLRIYREKLEGEPHREIPVHPESRHWFAHVGAGGARYLAELGYYRTKANWTRVAVSGPAVTPPDNLSDDTSVWFATLAGDPSSAPLLSLIQAALREQLPLQEALRQLRAQGHPDLPEPQPENGEPWTPAQEAALAQAVTVDHLRRVWMGSLEITELLQRQLTQGWSSQTSAAGAPSSWAGAVSSLSSPLGGLPGPRKGFWFNVNAELILYGATEKDATVTIGGRPIRLRADGTFSYRFSLPDGSYHLPAVAISADGSDARSAALAFSRATDYRGDVGQHPQDPALRPPRTEHVS